MTPLERRNWPVSLITVKHPKLVLWNPVRHVSYAEVGKVASKINSDEALSDEFVLKSIGDKALNDNFS